MALAFLAFTLAGGTVLLIGPVAAPLSGVHGRSAHEIILGPIDAREILQAGANPRSR